MPHSTVVELVDEVLRHRREDLLGHVHSWFTDLEAEIESRLQQVDLQIEARAGVEPAPDVKSSPNIAESVTANADDAAPQPARTAHVDSSTTYQHAKAKGSRLHFHKKIQVRALKVQAFQLCPNEIKKRGSQSREGLRLSVYER